MTKVTSWTSRGLWLLAVILMLPLLVLLGVRDWSSARGDIDFTCIANVADGKGMLAEKVKLDLTVRGHEAELVYGMHQDGLELGAIKLSGILTKWCAAELSYQLSFDKGQVVMDFGQSQLPKELEQVVTAGREPLSKGKPMTVSFRLLELERDRALVAFDKSQSLWSCDVKSRGSMAL